LVFALVRGSTSVNKRNTLKFRYFIFMDNCFLLDRDIRFYKPDFSGLDEVSADLAATMSAMANTWLRFPEQNVRDVIQALTKAYYFLNHQEYLLRSGKHYRLEEVKMFAGLIQVPRFVRDAIREFCRPMEVGAETWLPEFDVPATATKLTDLFGLDLELPKWQICIHDLDKKVKMDLVSVESEKVRAAPFAFWYASKKKLYCATPLPEWRIEAMLRLRHIRHSETPSISATPGEPAKERPPHIGEGGGDDVFGTVGAVEKAQSYLDVIVVGRHVGTQAFFVFEGTVLPMRYGMVGGSTRFPTENAHSNTPPSRGKGKIRKLKGKVDLKETNVEDV